MPGRRDENLRLASLTAHWACKNQDISVRHQVSLWRSAQNPNKVGPIRTLGVPSSGLWMSHAYPGRNRVGLFPRCFLLFLLCDLRSSTERKGLTPWTATLRQVSQSGSCRRCYLLDFCKGDLGSFLQMWPDEMKTLGLDCNVWITLGTSFIWSASCKKGGHIIAPCNTRRVHFYENLMRALS